MSQWLGGTSDMRSAPARMSFQKPVAETDPGNKALTPTTAMGLRVGVVMRNYLGISRTKAKAAGSGQGPGWIVEGGGRHGHAVAAKLLGARDDGGPFEQVER